MDFFLVYLLPFLFCVSLLPTSSALDYQPELSLTNLTRGNGLYCFDQSSHPGVGTTNSADCRGALRTLASLPEYRSHARLRFSKNPRNGIRVPKGFQHDQCIIYLSCANDRDSEYFTLADIFTVALGIIKECVDQPVVKYGGLDYVGNVGTFYVSVGISRTARGSSSSSATLPRPTTGAEDTFGTLVESALTELSDGDTGVSAES